VKIPNLPQPALTDYVNALPNTPIGFFKGNCEIQVGVKRMTLQGTVFLNWHTSPRIQISLSGPGEFARGIERQFASFSVDCALSKRPIVVDGSNVHVSHRDPVSLTTIDGTVQNSIETGAGPFAALIVHFANLRLSGIDIIGAEWNGSEMMWTGRREFATDEWLIRLDAVQNYDEIIKTLTNDGGYSITHTATLTRHDRTLFSFDDAEEILFELDRFLSFCQGSSTQAFFHVGISQAAKPTWHLWTAPKISSWSHRRNWAMPDHDKESMLLAFEGFRLRMADPQWKEVFLRSVEWYLDSNREAIGTDGSIILAQAALEMISWNTFTVEKSVSVAGFEKLPASDRLRLLLMNSEVPLQVPACLLELSRKAKELNWPDVAEAVSVVRNKLAHPNRRNLDVLGGMGTEVIDEVYVLTMFLLEAVLLRQLNYKGTYFNRVIGQKEAFP
jgi:hypothetical protein